uniref:Uncharacterized protein n=1 Tax=Atrato Virga-like virus 6 TaxID=2689345 RepID=A0A6B9KG55_9VIRU|nr:hypothetical protein [Atrato Virga-like virus 6]
MLLLLVLLNLPFVRTFPLTASDSLAPCSSPINFHHTSPNYKMLVQYGRLEFSSECFKATIGKSCNLPTHCNSVSSHHLTIDNKIVLICIGYLGDTTALRTLRFYQISSMIPIVPQDLLFVAVAKLDGKLEHAFLLPGPLLSAFAHHPVLSHDFYVNTDFKICKRGDSLSALSPYLKRRLTLNNGLLDNYVLDHKHLPFVCESNKRYICSDKLSNDGNFKRSTCRSLIVVNSTHALCSHVWVQFPDKLCPTDYKYRTGMYTYPEICTSISESDESKLKTEGNWLTKALVAVVDWLFKATEKVIDFLEKCLLIIFERLGVLIYKQLLTIESVIEDWDEQYLLFELLLINFYLVYKSNSTAAILFTIIFGIVVGYTRESLGINFRVLSLLRFVGNSTLF